MGSVLSSATRRGLCWCAGLPALVRRSLSRRSALLPALAIGLLAVLLALPLLPRALPGAFAASAGPLPPATALPGAAGSPVRARLEAFGRQLYNDETLSVGRNMSCATCHSLRSGGTAADDLSNRRLGLHPGSAFQSYEQPPSAENTFAWRNIQTNTYAVFSPPLHRSRASDGSVQMVGGNFWDGRALGFLTGRPTQEQATVPPLGTLEQALPSPACVVARVVQRDHRNPYPITYASLFGTGLATVQWPEDLERLCRQSDSVVDMPRSQDDGRVQRAYSNLSMALWAYQHSSQVVPFNSRFDAYSQGRARLNAAEQRGLALFNGKAKCAGCHVSTTAEGLPGALFTDFTYDNLGLPRNPDNPIYRFPLINPDGRDWVDLGLGGFLQHQDSLRDQINPNMGKFKVPTLRNVDRRPRADFVRSYMHNGYFRSLEQVVDFYNSRDTKPRCQERFLSADQAEQQGCWPEPEVPATVNRSELGNLGLSPEEQRDLVSFLKTLTDR
ncbi:MAG: cytochrome c peroxidase [Synechococcaceae cyanobacterium]|nr:cytochrome c peroxidase [Synechococcaceae cyanobacterium]